MYILDSSLLIEVIQKKPRAAKIMESLGKEQAVTTSISVHELFQGSNDKEEFVIRGILKGMDVLSFDFEDAQISGKLAQKLYKQGKPINKADLLIAGICLSHDATLVTLDNDFRNIPELKTIGV